MSIVLLTLVFACVRSDPSCLTAELLYLWALFSIADALWARVVFGGK